MECSGAGGHGEKDDGLDERRGDGDRGELISFLIRT